MGDLLGRGGMGQVHMARHRSGHLVAIKRVRDTLSGDLLVRDRLAKEASLLRRVKHPNVIRALDAGQDTDGTPYLVMDPVHGSSLAQLAKTGPLPLARIASITAQLLAGLAAIHAAGVVHADIKSSNVMIDESDHVQIIDFGLARTISRFEVNGLIAGTPSYMAPEVIAGEPARVAADIYAVGAIVYELLTGSPPFRGPLAAILVRQLHEVAEPPSKRAPNAGIAPEVDAVVLKALSREPAHRHASADELAGAFVSAFSTEHELPDLLELSTTRDFWGAATIRREAKPVDAEAQSAPTRPLDANVIITSALERVRTHVDAKDVDSAIKDLEITLSMLRSPEEDVSASVWRLESVLAALYDHTGRREAATRVARLAHHHALRGTAEGPKLRTREILDRISARPQRMARGSKLIKTRGSRQG
ncbi:MAG: serine/threonine-protein kinase [Kofleriaceae bacterium]